MKSKIKMIIAAVSAVILLSAALCGCGRFVYVPDGAQPVQGAQQNDAQSNGEPKTAQQSKPTAAADAALTVKKGDWESIEWETYTDPSGYFTLEKPKSWQVDVTDMFSAGRTAGLAVGVTNPDETVGVDIVDFGTVAASSMKSATVESLFQDALFHKLINFTIKESSTAEWQQSFINNNPDLVIDAKVIRGEYTDPDQNDAREVICQAILEKALLTGYYGYVTAYSAYTVKGELDNWIDDLARIQTSFKTTETYANRYKSSGNSGSSGGYADSGSTASYDAGDAMMDSWNARNKSEDIYAQKQSDVTLGYERVYDTETGEIYKAESGFLDWYDSNDGKRYAAATDDMYTEGYSGWIEAPDY